MRPAPRATRALASGIVLTALMTSILPALPAIARAPVKVTGREVKTAVDHQRIVPLPIEASHVFLKWRGAFDAQLSVAFGQKPNELGEEVVIEPGDDDQPPDADDHNTHHVAPPADESSSDVIWTGGARFVRVTTDRPIGKLTVVAIDARADIGLIPGPSGVVDAAMDQPTIIPRSGWGADESLRFDASGEETWPPEFSPMQKAIVHHTAGRNGDPNPAATIRAIYWAKSISHGYGDIGYNFLIDEAGRIYEGRHSRNYAPGEPITGEDLAGSVVRGVHAQGTNFGTVGIALLGNFQNRQPTTAARVALERLLAWKLERHGLDPLGGSTYVGLQGPTKWLYNISGHRNVYATACPGESFYPTFPQLRQRVANRIAATTGPSHDTTPPTVESLRALAATPTGGTTIPFGLIFSEPVDGLDASDFGISGSSHGWDVTDVSGGPVGYTVEVSASHPDDGTVQLELGADAVTDFAGLTGPPDAESAQATYAQDGDAPTVVLYQTPHRKYINDAKLNYFNVTAAFSEPVTGFEPGDVVLGGTSHTARHWSVPAIFGEDRGTNYGFSVEQPGWVNGTLTFQIPDGAVTDLAGNPVAASNLVTIFLDRSAPSTSSPRVTVSSNTTLASGALRVRLDWSASDAGPAGIATFDIARSVDGAPFRILKGGVSTPYFGAAVTPGHTYRYEVRAHDKAGNVSGWKAGTTIKPTLVQQTSGLVHFTGPTGTGSKSSYSGGSVRYLAAGGASAWLQTSARSLSFVTTKGPGRGEIRIYVDGVFQTAIDLGAATTTYRYVAYARTWSTVGTHRITVVAVGTPGRQRVDVDAFGVVR
jgi:hypothetical protein